MKRRAQPVPYSYLCLGALAAIAVICAGSPGCVFYLNPQCDDQIKNGEETDIDCGGTCGPCNIGDACNRDGDCFEGTCARAVCAPLPCANGVRDGDETDVDCGGSACRKCGGGRTCEAADDCFSGDCVAGNNTCFTLGTVSFAPAAPYESGQKTYALFSGDLNNDGRIDLVAANEQDSALRVFLNTGSGVFQALPNAFPTGEYPTGGAIADFNGDGNADVITADYHGDSTTILLGTGTGALGPRTSYPAIADGETSNLALGDLNGDGNLDVVATNQRRASISMYLGAANGTLRPAVDIPVGISGSSEPFSAAIADFDGNGMADLAIADNRTGTVVVRLGNGDGTFLAEVPYPIGGGPSYVMISGDLDRDGKPDLAIANRNSSNVSVLLGRGDGGFKKPVIASTGTATGPYAIAIADFNLDGVPDLVTANYLSSTGTILLGNGDGTFERPIDAGPTGMVSYGVAVGDFNNDGMPDFATANANSNNITVKLNTSH